MGTSLKDFIPFQWRKCHLMCYLVISVWPDIIQGFSIKKFESKLSYNWGAMSITSYVLVRVKLLSIGNHSNTLVTGCSKDARAHEKEEGWDFEIYGREGNQLGRLQGNYIRVMIL